MAEPQKKKYLCSFQDKWCEEEDFKIWVRKVDDITAECKLCRHSFSVKYEGKRALVTHAESQKHKDIEKQQRRTPQITSFFAKRDSSQENLIIAAEVGQVYHSVLHHLSYASLDCGNKMLPKILPDSDIAKKISCGRTKASSITEGVLAPKSQELLLKDLETAHFFSIASDASNKGNKKFFPLAVRYFSATEGIKHGLLDFYKDDNETSAAIATRITGILNENGLSTDNISGYVADNASVNFGKHNSVYQKLKEKNAGLIQCGCKCHIIHNCLKNAMKTMSFDMETLVLKIYSEFSSSAKNATNLASFFEFVEMEYHDVLRHVPTRWLSLLPAVERVLHSWPALRAYFVSEGEDQCNRTVWEAFSAEEPESLPLCYVYFLHNLMGIFHSSVKNLERNEANCTELHPLMEDLRFKLKQRRRDRFYGRSAEVILRNLSSADAKKFREEAAATLTRCITYLEKWYDYEGSIFKLMPVLSLSSPVTWPQIETLVTGLQLDIDTDRLYDEHCVVVHVQGEIAQESSVDQKWVQVLRRLPEGSSEMKKLISFALSIPVSNAYCERVFSLMTQLWSKERNRMTEDLVKAELQVLLNYNMTCGEFYEYLKKNPDLLRAAKRQEKYKFKRRELGGQQ